MDAGPVMRGAGADLGTDEHSFAEAVFFHECRGDEGIVIVGDIVAFGVTEESVAAVMNFEHSVEGAFNDRRRCSTIGGFAGLRTGTMVTAETLTTTTHRLAAAIVRTTAVAAAATRTSAFETTEFSASRRTIEARWSLIAPRWSLITTRFKARASITGRPIATATTTTTTTTATTVPFAGFTFGRRPAGRFFAASIVGTFVRADELVTPVSKVVSIGLVTPG